MLRGFSLLELLLVLAVFGLLLGIAAPRFARAIDQLEVEAATSQVVGAHQRARMMAITRGQVLTLEIEPSQLSITRRDGMVPLWSQAGPAAAGIAFSGLARRVTFSPTGITLGLSNASLVLSRGSSIRTIVFSRLGRVRIVR